MDNLIKLFIAGQWTEGHGGDILEVVNPATEEVISRVCMAEKEDLTRALVSTHKGFELWKNTAATERSRIIHKSADLMRVRMDKIAEVCTREQGKPIGQSKFEIMITANYFDDLAECGLRVAGRTTPQEPSGVRRHIRYEPIGPVYAAAPWNLPAMMPGRKIATALAAGCSVIVKPSEETPQTPAMIVQCLLDAGLPEDVINLVYGDPPFISDFLLSSPVIRKISFTGSTPVGKELAAKAGAQMKKITMELGGHAPLIVDQDVDLDNLIHTIVPARYANSGQSCMAATRFFVHEQIYDDFIARFVEGVRALRVGNGMDDGVTMGPLTSKRRINHMHRLINDAVDQGANLQCGGKKIPGPGYFFEPTVISDVDDDMIIMKEEPFGPVTPISSFNDWDTVIGRANSTPYGLAAYLFTNDLQIAQKVSDELDVGLLGINTMQVAGTAVPFGGVKDSGIGREGAIEGILECMVIKAISQG